ncbi:MAG: hypothetical protein Ct9H300mP12_12910 [Acidimicrobiales bacterium]|nr:MAG: hypothetical protein Ct9H300mP12_12910 [Acidimicrobiales bacterium]
MNGIGPGLTQTPQVDYLADEARRRPAITSGSLGTGGPVGLARRPGPGSPLPSQRLSSFVTGHNVPVDGGTLAGGGWFFSPEEAGSSTGQRVCEHRRDDGRGPTEHQEGVAGSVDRPLDGIRILAVEQMAALPFATQLMARLGAEVSRSTPLPLETAGGLLPAVLTPTAVRWGHLPSKQPNKRSVNPRPEAA